MLLLIFDMI